MQSSAPALVIISGAPASGKSTLADRLSFDLRLPIVAKDELKEALADAIGPPSDVPASMQLGQGAYAMLYLFAQRLLEARTGLIVESNFQRGVSETDLRPLLAWSDPCLIHCSATPEVVQARYAARHERGDRHPAHLDANRAAALADGLAAGHFDPLDLPIPTLIVDTTDGWHPAYEDIRDFAAFPRASLAR
ncbi:MAG: AAA family ATPase [Candidatus Limnocylindria bacterium]